MTTVRLYTYSLPEKRAIRGLHQHEAVQVDNEMLVLLSGNKKSEILNLHRRLELSMAELEAEKLDAYLMVPPGLQAYTSH